MAGSLEYFAIENVSLSGRELYIPAISQGSVGTLALDLMMNSMPHRIIGRFLTTHFKPIVGINAVDNVKSNLNTNVELFVGESDSYAILQIRSPPSQRRGPDFVNKLIEWARA
jgi:predicted ATP-grasp superfamily ATP-dependent carboligase